MPQSLNDAVLATLIAALHTAIMFNMWLQTGRDDIGFIELQEMFPFPSTMPAELISRVKKQFGMKKIILVQIEGGVASGPSNLLLPKSTRLM